MRIQIPRRASLWQRYGSEALGVQLRAAAVKELRLIPGSRGQALRTSRAIVRANTYFLQVVCGENQNLFPIPARSAHNSTFVFASSHSILFSPPTANTGSITASAMTHTMRMSSSSLTDHNQISTQASTTIRPASATPNQTKPSSSQEIIGRRLTRIRSEDD